MRTADHFKLRILISVRDVPCFGDAIFQVPMLCFIEMESIYVRPRRPKPSKNVLAAAMAKAESLEKSSVDTQSSATAATVEAAGAHVSGSKTAESTVKSEPPPVVTVQPTVSVPLSTTGQKRKRLEDDAVQPGGVQSQQQSSDSTCNAKEEADTKFSQIPESTSEGGFKRAPSQQQPLDNSTSNAKEEVDTKLSQISGSKNDAVIATGDSVITDVKLDSGVAGGVTTLAAAFNFPGTHSAARSNSTSPSPVSVDARDTTTVSSETTVALSNAAVDTLPAPPIIQAEKKGQVPEIAISKRRELLSSSSDEENTSVPSIITASPDDTQTLNERVQMHATAAVVVTSASPMAATMPPVVTSEPPIGMERVGSQQTTATSTAYKVSNLLFWCLAFLLLSILHYMLTMCVCVHCSHKMLRTIDVSVKLIGVQSTLPSSTQSKPLPFAKVWGPPMRMRMSVPSS